MKNFTLNLYTKLIFGKDTLDSLSDNIKKYTNKTILLTYGGGSIKRSGLYEKVINNLEANNIKYIELGGIKPNPEVYTARKGIEIIKENDIEFILAVGGGSVLDNSKHMAMGAATNEDIWSVVKDSSLVSTIDSSKLPKIGTIITLAATGSEMNSGGVMTNPEEELKLGSGHPLVAPVFTYEDPTQLYTLPEYQKRAGVCDMISHLLEVYFDSHSDSMIDDRLVEAIFKNILDNKDKYIESENDYDSAANIFYSSTLALNGLTRMTRSGADWLSHSMEHEVSAVTGLTHGIGLAIIHPQVINYYYEKDMAEKLSLVKYENLGVNVFGFSKDEDDLALKTVNKIQETFKEISQVSTLSDVEITDYDYLIASKKLEATVGSTYHKLGEKDYQEIYKRTL